MNRWILTHARLAFWLWTVPSLALLVWYAARNEGEGLMTAYALFVIWEAAGFWGIQRIPVRLGPAAGIPGDGRVL